MNSFFNVAQQKNLTSYACKNIDVLQLIRFFVSVYSLLD